MKRLHIHIGVADIPASIRYYSALFGAPPSVEKPDYAKWLLDDPAANIAISKRSGKTGVDHLGIQVDEDGALEAYTDRLTQAGLPAVAQPDATCCYARSNKSWSRDPQNTVWELFYSFDGFETYGSDEHEALIAGDGEKASCCAPAPQNGGACCPAPAASNDER